MFTEPLEAVLNTTTLLTTLEAYKEHDDYQLVFEECVSGELTHKLYDGSYVPVVNDSFSLNKSDGSKRIVSASSLRSKVIQKCIATALQREFRFSAHSFAYQSGKNPLMAFNQTLKYLNNGFSYVIRCDIDSFFDTINQTLLSEKLYKALQDKRLVKLVMLFVSNGTFDSNKWTDKESGVHQGDALSPFLSNFYLNDFDMQLETEQIAFVRFSDDMVLFAKSRNEADAVYQKTLLLLKTISLRFNSEKTRIVHHSKGFEYLGLYYRPERISIDPLRLEKKVEAVASLPFNVALEQMVTILNEQVHGFLSYYGKVLSDNSQFAYLQAAIDDKAIQCAFHARKTGAITQKSKMRQILHELIPLKPKRSALHRLFVDKLIAEVYALWQSDKPLQSAKEAIGRKKQHFLKHHQSAHELTLARHGMFIGFSRGKAVVKEKGRVVKKMPIKTLKRVIVNASVSLSSEFIFQCAEHSVGIDFIRHNTPYAMISYYKSVSHPMRQKQHAAKEDKRALQFAKAFVFAKSKNQINLVKYFARYRKKNSEQEFAMLQSYIESMERSLTQCKSAWTKEELRGFEGATSSAYWKAFGVLIGDVAFVRRTRNAPDAINQSLNYGYAILYNRVQSALIDAGLDIYISYLHEHQSKKPTLVFDMIEEFRQLCVDKEIISMLSQKQPIETIGGQLTPQSVKAVTQNIQERLGSQVRWRKGKYQLINIISEQARFLGRCIDEGLPYKGFVGRF